MHSHSMFKPYFLRTSIDVDRPIIVGDTLTVNAGPESYDTIYNKTMVAMRWLLEGRDDFSYIIRTNLSTAWNFPRLQSLIKQDVFPKTKCYAGFSGYDKDNQVFISGAGIIMSRDVCQILVDEYNLEDTVAIGTPDDVRMAQIIKSRDIALMHVDRQMFTTNKCIIKSDIDVTQICYRVKNRRRGKFDIQNMSMIINVLLRIQSRITKKAENAKATMECIT